MDPKKKESLEAAGWKVGTAKEFFGLNEEENQEVESRVRKMLKDRGDEGEFQENLDGRDR